MGKNKRQKWDKKIKNAVKAEPLGHAKAEVVVREVPNAGFNPRYVNVFTGEPDKGNPRTERAYVNCKESPAAYWYYHEIIDDAQYRMATDIRRWFEMAGGAGASAIDYERVKVDTSGIQDPISDQRMQASANLKRVSRLLRDDALYGDLHAICAQGITMKKRWPSQRVQKKMGIIIQDALSFLAAEFGYKLRKTG